MHDNATMQDVQSCAFVPYLKSGKLSEQSDKFADIRARVDYAAACHLERNRWLVPYEHLTPANLYPEHLRQADDVGLSPISLA